jgi:hypothetical protein
MCSQEGNGMRTRYLAIGSLLAMSTPATAGASADDLARCAVNAATAADRTVLIRWAFILAAANPDVADMASISDTKRQQDFRAAASVLNRILVHDCRRESVAALRTEGSSGMLSGFRALGELGGRGLISSPASSAAGRETARYMDQADLTALLREAGISRPANTP